MNKIFLYSILVLIISCNKTKQIKRNNTKTTNNSVNMNYIKKNSYRIYTRLNECQAELYVDDVLAFSFMGEITTTGRTAVDVLINPFLLKSGKHSICLKMYPQHGKSTLSQDSYGEIRNYFMNVENYDQETDLFTLETPNGDKTNLKNLPYFELKSELIVELPFKIEGWSNSVNLKEEMENKIDVKKQLLESYDNLRQIIKKRDTEEFTKLIQEREDILGIAFYSSAKDKINDLQEMLNIIKNPNYELQPYPQNPVLVIHANGKLASFLTVDREGIIELINHKDENTITFDFKFHKKSKNGKFTII